MQTNSYYYVEQNGSCCQLISAINARMYLLKKDCLESEIVQFIQKLKKIVKCQHGPAIDIEKSYPILKLDFEDGPIDLIWIKNNLPVELALHDPKKGFHSGLVINVNLDELELVNCSVSIITWEEILNWIPTHIHNQRCRSFKMGSEIKCPKN